MNNLRYLWHHPYGRLAILLTVVGAVGLVTQFWSAAPLLLALPRRGA